MSLILDSSMLIAEERGTWDGRRFAREAIGNQRTAICSITASEFLHGCFHRFFHFKGNYVFAKS